MPLLSALDVFLLFATLSHELDPISLSSNARLGERRRRWRRLSWWSPGGRCELPEDVGGDAAECGDGEGAADDSGKVS